MTITFDLDDLATQLAQRLGDRVPDAEWSRLRIGRAVPRGATGIAMQCLVERPSESAAVLSASLPAGSTVDQLAEAEWAVFPEDPELGDLGAWMESRSHLGEARLLSYRYGRRAVVCVDTGAHPRIFKCMRRKRVATAVSRLRAVGTACTDVDAFELPELLEVDGNVLEFAWFAGEGPFAIEDVAVIRSKAERAGRAIRALHDSGIVSGAHFAVGDELELLAGWCCSLRGMMPASVDAVEALLPRLDAWADRIGLADVQPRPIHRDFYDKQLLFDPHRTLLLDFDLLSSGDPAQDLGNYLAHTTLRALQRGQGRIDVREGDVAFLQGYGAAPPRVRVDWWTASALARLTLLYSLRTPHSTLAEKLLARIAEVMAPWN